jgi:hypothetical protein
MGPMRRALLSLALVAAALALSSCTQPPPIRGQFLHHVYFWLNEPENPAAREEFLTALRKMEAIPTVRNSYIGTTAGIDRDVVDNTWTFYWLVTFDDRAGWQVYNDHPLHDEFRTKSALWSRVQVYDIVPVPAP